MSHLPIFATKKGFMKVFKFGGASVSTPERIKNVACILESYKKEQLLLVISAIGKTTNALEKVVEAFVTRKREVALQLFQTLKEEHLQIARELVAEPIIQLNDLFTEVEWLLHDEPVQPYDYYYDQVVCVGELLSTSIVSAYLNKKGIANTWVDVRDVIRTDANFRDAAIDWEITQKKVKEYILPLYKTFPVVLTQGFIGATDENESTTLGREGSDYTAAVFANLLQAESQIIWKDVKGVMNADPKLYAKAQWIEELSYREVIEMAYYGAQVIHPKTIKPLQNKGIPLFVRSFLEPQASGTVIHIKSSKHLPPIIVYKENQVLVQVSSKDFSFVSEGLTAAVYKLFEEVKLKPNLTQNAAISLLCVLDNSEDKVKQFAIKASPLYDVQVSMGLTLLTIRHYTPSILEELLEGKNPLLQQRTKETIQTVYITQ